MPLSVTLRDLVNSYAQLRRAADNASDQPANLLRFYSVECGLKALVLKRNKLRTTDQLPKDLVTHDLRRLADALRLSPNAYRDLLACRRAVSGVTGHPPVEVRQLHEAWRYGARLHDQDERRSVAGLAALGQRCREEFGR